MYYLGEEAGAVLDSTGATQDDRKVYDSHREVFDSYFKVVKMSYTREPDSIVEQLQGESAEQYIMELYRLAETCDWKFHGGNDSRQTSHGITDNALSEHMQLYPDLTCSRCPIVLQGMPSAANATAEATTPVTALLQQC